MKYTAATWLRSRYELYAKPHIRPSTMNYYRRNIEQHIIPAIGDIPLNKLTTRDLQKLYGVHSTGRRGTAETGARQARHATDAAKGHGENGQLHGAGSISPTGKQSTGKEITSSPVLFGSFRTVCGQICSQRGAAQKGMLRFVL